jgi:ADP-ribosylglycohydrolase
MAVAVAAAIAHPDDRPQGRAFLEEVLGYVPEGETRRGIERALDIRPGEIEKAARQLGTGQFISAQDTVPFCLWSAAYHLEDYEAAMWHTVGGLGDRDTTCAIVGGIVALAAGGIPGEWVDRREPLPGDFQLEL